MDIAAPPDADADAGRAGARQATKGERARAWWRLALGIVLALSAVVVLATRWSPVLAGHPALTITLVVAIGAGIALGAAAIDMLRSSARRGTAAGPSRDGWAIVGHVIASVAVVMVSAVLLWLRPLGATQTAIDALADGGGVHVVQSLTRVELRPTGTLRSTGIVFYPGAKVDARAYAHILRPLAEAGHLVVIIKLPYNIAFTDVNAASSVISAEHEVPRWVVAGHSLGGTVAARYARTNRPAVVGLVLWASYPAGSLRDRTGLEVLSVSASNDGLATPAKIERSRADLPPDATFVEVQGAVHADFGNYGAQSGDGQRTISLEDAQRQIVQATATFLDTLDTTVP